MQRMSVMVRTTPTSKIANNERLLRYTAISGVPHLRQANCGLRFLVCLAFISLFAVFCLMSNV